MEIAESFLKNHLPQFLIPHLDFSTLTIVKDSFADKELREHFSDILYTVQIKKNLLYIYLLFEHKSRKERFVSLQILRYMLKIWDQHIKQNPKTKKLPPVFPMVLYHGRGNGTFLKNLRGAKMQVNLTEFSRDVMTYLKMAGTGKEIFIISQGKIIARVIPPADDAKIFQKKSRRGCLHHYAKPELIANEEEAWQESVREKYVPC
ncbi:MAG: Rpn family recombination-promoting nuclease/putative transposase [Desulfococcaceae bacterium]